MLVHNDKLVPLLLSTLMLEPEHPRKKMAEHLKAGIQADGIESIAQLALFDRGRELLLQHEAVLAGLQWVIEEHSGTSPELKESARGAMMALNGVEQHDMHIVAEHVMLSYSWADQQMVSRINKSLQRRQYTTWMDGAYTVHKLGITPARLCVCVQFSMLEDELATACAACTIARSPCACYLRGCVGVVKSISRADEREQ
jgi:hypothetical protein